MQNKQAKNSLDSINHFVLFNTIFSKILDCGFTFSEVLPVYNVEKGESLLVFHSWVLVKIMV